MYGGGWVRNAPMPGTNVSLGSTLYSPGGQQLAWTQGIRAQPSQTQAPSQTQTSSQAQQSEQPSPRQPVSTLGAGGGNYGYPSPGNYGSVPVAPLPGASPQGPMQTSGPQPSVTAAAPSTPSLVFSQPEAQQGMTSNAPQSPRGPIMPMNPLHAAIQSQMARGVSDNPFQVPYFSDLLNRRYKGNQ